MGYRHTWTRPVEIEQETFAALGADFLRLLPRLERSGVLLGNAFGEGLPTIDDSEVVFNGRSRCRCKPRRRALQSLLDGASSPEEALDRALRLDPGQLYDLDWQERRCGVGGCACDTFAFPRVVEGSARHGGARQECKTNRRSYDLAVTCFLLIAKRHLGDRLTVYSDSRERWWDEPRELCQEVLGYGDGMGIAVPWEEGRQAAR